MSSELWWDQRLVGLDLETTSPDPEEARIVHATVVLCGGGEETVAESWLVDPGVEIPEAATEVHGITTAQARAEGIPPAQAVEELVTTLAEQWEWPLVVFNARYDLTVLDREARRNDYEAVLRLERVIDPLVIDKHLDRYRKGSRKLTAICEHHHARLDGAHDSSFDAIAACRLAWVLGRRGIPIRRVRNDSEARELHELVAEWNAIRRSPARLHEAQERWAAEQALGLAEYFVKQGDMENARQVRREWPVVPVASPVA